MIAPRKLAHPPIREAVLEVLLHYPSTVNLKFLSGYGALISSKYPKRENVINISGNLSNDSESKISRDTIGYVYYSEDKKTYIQTRLNGFSFVQANQSYTNWNTFKPLAFNELRSFLDFIGPSYVTRFSLRFINEIKIPSSQDFKDYVRISSNIDILNLPIRNLIFRAELDKPEIGALAVVTELISPPFEPTINMFLDIDVIINNPTPLAINLEYLSEQFEKLRDFKNSIFFSALTEKTINSYS